MRQLRDAMVRKKAFSLDKPKVLLTDEDQFPDGCVTPATQRAYEIVQQRAKDFTPPVRVAEGGSVTIHLFEVQRSAEAVSRVNLGCLPHGPFQELCSCGKSASQKLWCDYVQSVFHHSAGDWRRWLKPWLTSDSWEKQLEPAFNSPTPRSICEQVSLLHDNGVLRRLEQPTVRPTPRGRPAVLKPTAATKIIRNSLEGMAEAVRAQQAAGDVAAGAALAKTEEVGECRRSAGGVARLGTVATSVH